MVPSLKGVASDVRSNALLFGGGSVAVPGVRRQPTGAECTRVALSVLSIRLFSSLPASTKVPAALSARSKPAQRHGAENDGPDDLRGRAHIAANLFGRKHRAQ